MRNMSELLLFLHRKYRVWIRVASVVLCCVVLLLWSVRIAAQSEPQTTVPPFACSTDPQTLPLVGENNVQKAFNFFVHQGLTPIQSAGIVGNLLEESHMNPAIHEGGALSPPHPIPNVGFGIAQWTPVSRQQNLVTFALARGQPVTDLATQLSFIWYEMTTVPVWRDVLPNIRTAQTVEDAAFIFHRDFERSADTLAMIQERVAAGENVFARYGQAPIPPPPVPENCTTPIQIPDCAIYGIDGKIRVGQMEGNEAILACARLFDPYGYDLASNNVSPREWLLWWERQGEFKNKTFRHIVDCSSLEMFAIYLAFGQELIFNTDTIDRMPQFFRKIPVAEARPGDIMVRPGHSEIAVTNGGTRTFGARTATIDPAAQISETGGTTWTAAYVYIGPGSTRK